MKNLKIVSFLNNSEYIFTCLRVTFHNHRQIRIFKVKWSYILVTNWLVHKNFSKNAKADTDYKRISRRIPKSNRNASWPQTEPYFQSLMVMFCSHRLTSIFISNSDIPRLQTDWNVLVPPQIRRTFSLRTDLQQTCGWWLETLRQMTTFHETQATEHLVEEL